MPNLFSHQESHTRTHTVSDDPRSAILGAATALLASGGPAAVTTRGVAEAAGVRAPTIYRLFGDKEGLIDAIAARALESYIATQTARAAEGGEDPIGELRDGWRMHVDFGLSNPQLYALLNDPVYSQKSPVATAGLNVLRQRIHRLAECGLLRVNEKRALVMIKAAGDGTVSTLLAVPPDERDLGLPDAIFDAVEAAILTSAPAPPISELSALTITFAAAVPRLASLSDAERSLMTQWLVRAIEQPISAAQN